MKNSDGWQIFPRPALASVLIIGGLVLVTGASHAVTAVGSASATVVDSGAVIITVPPLLPAATPAPVPAVVQTAPALSGTIFTVESFTGSLSSSGPLLRAVSAPPPVGAGNVVQTSGAAEAGAPGATAAPGSLGAGAAPAAASAATVNVTRNADGSLAVSGGAGLTFAVSQLVNGSVNIEYN